jgi:hypothetical protein
MTGHAAQRGSVTGLIAGPLALLANIETGYVLSTFACGRPSAALLVTAAFAAISLASAFVSWRALSSADGDSRPRRLLATAGFGLSLYCAVIILVQGAATVFVAACVP